MSDIPNRIPCKRSTSSQITGNNSSNKVCSKYFKNAKNVNNVSSKRHKKDKKDDNEASTSSTKKMVLTALESQIECLKCRHPHLLLMVECGYRYRFFGEDADKAALALHIGINPAGSRHFGNTTSVPIAANPATYISRLVSSGHKVGLVRQHRSDEKQGLFTRELSHVFTQSRLMSAILDLDTISENAQTYLANLNCKNFLLTALQVATGKLLFEQLHSLADFKEILRMLGQVELVVDENEVDFEHREFLQNLESEQITIELIKGDENEVNVDEEVVIDTTELEEINDATMETIEKSLGFLRRQLYPIQMSFVKLSRICSNESEKSMCLPAMTLANMEILRPKFSSRQFSKMGSDGSLLHYLNRCRSKCGERLLALWLSAPSNDLAEIERRQDVIEFLAKNEQNVADILNHIANFDIEVTLASAQCNTLKPVDFFKLIRCCCCISKSAKDQLRVLKKAANHLREILDNIENKLGIVTKDEKLQNLNMESTNNKSSYVSLFIDHSDFSEIQELKKDITELEEKMKTNLDQSALEMGLNSLNFVTISQQEYLVELKHNEAPLVPDTWLRVNATTSVVRFRPSVVTEVLPLLQLRRDQLEQECKTIWQTFLKQFVRNHYTRLKEVVEKIAELDVLQSLAQISGQEGFVRPLMQSKESSVLEIINGRNIIIESQIKSSHQLISNSCNLSKAMIISGPNMGGKSSFVRQVGQIVLLAHIGCFVPATSATMSLIDAIFARLGFINDSINEGKSTLMVELDETFSIIKRATRNSLVIIDELGRGTGTNEGAAIACATLKHLLLKNKCKTLFVTHFRAVMRLEEQLENVSNYHMQCHVTDESDVCLLYKLARGQSEKSFGINVARLAGISELILNRANSVCAKVRSN